MDTQIRPGNIADIPHVARVHVASWKSTYGEQVPQSYLDNLSVPEHEIMWREAFQNPSHRMLVAERSGKVVGFVSYGPSRDTDATPPIGEIYAIYLREEDKGQGIGTALWEETRKTMQKLGYPEIMLWVLDSNLRARQFYEQLGFTRDGGEKHDDLGGQRVLELRYRLHVR